MTPVLDAHHHIWRMADLAWLQGPMQPRIFGPYEPLRRDYPIGEFRADLDGHGVVGSVYIQVNWPPGGEVDEACWVQSVADETGWPNAIVGYVDFAAADAADTLAELARVPLMRGIRQQLHWHENPEYKFAPTPDLMNDPTWRAGFAHIQDHGWPFDLQVFTSQMADAAIFAGDFPDVPMILQHAGMPEDTSAAGMAAWRDGMRRFADLPNIHAKLSGLGTFLHRNDPAFIAEIVGETVEMFGAARCVYGSNFPIEKLWTDYGPLIGAYRDAVASLPEEDQRAIFFDNAVRLYRPAGIEGNR